MVFGNRIMDNFRENLLDYLNGYLHEIQDSKGNWTVKGFIDIAKNIYTISADTKVISKVLEIMLFPKIQQFAKENNLDIILCKEQNFYPDITFIYENNRKIALDLKTTYRRSETTVSGFTLGAFTGYFRDRKSTKNITFPYSEYEKHYVLGVIYTKQDKHIDEYKVYSIKDLKRILSVITDIELILQEKYKIASDKPWSGNIKHIGSTTRIRQLREGSGIFAKYGSDVFDDYWLWYIPKKLARKTDYWNPPYQTLKQYCEYKPRVFQRTIEERLEYQNNMISSFRS